jgi:hypothetical protein
VLLYFIFFVQEDTIDLRLVPKVGMTFSGVDEAYKFYSRYAYEVGFPLKKYRERNTSSKRTQCKAGMKLKKIYDDAKETVISVRIDLLHLDHNHEFF